MSTEIEEAKDEVIAYMRTAGHSSDCECPGCEALARLDALLPPPAPSNALLREWWEEVAHGIDLLEDGPQVVMQLVGAKFLRWAIDQPFPTDSRLAGWALELETRHKR